MVNGSYRKYTACCLFALVILFSGNAFSQTLGTARSELLDPSEISNEIFLQTDEDVFSDQLQFLTDDIERLGLEHISLQMASRNDLLGFPFLTNLDISKIFRGRRFGISLDPGILQRWRGFASIAPQDSSHYIFLRTRAVIDPQAYQQSVYLNDSYHGSPLKTSSRIIAKTDDVLFSMTEAKDPGEPMYFDFISGSFAISHSIGITDNLAISKFVLGDYSISFGSGLLFSNNYSLLPMRDIHSAVEPHSTGINPYISSSPLKYFRGAASEITSGIISVSGFFSDRNIDATIVSDTITSLYASGLHRTASEIARKDQARSSLTGAHIAITPLDEDNYLEVGVTGYQLNYDKVVALQNSSGFHGQKHSMISADVQSTISDVISINSEFAHMNSDAGLAHAYTISMVAQPLAILEFSANYRNLPANFISPFGSTFGNNAVTAQNETGWYFGSKITPIPNRFSLYGSANLSSSVSTSSEEIKYSDVRFGVIYSFHVVPLRLLAEIRSYGKGPVFSITNDSLSKRSIHFNADMHLIDVITLSFRSEYQQFFSQTTLTAQHGTLNGLTITYTPLSGFTLSSGITYFNTDSYSSRFYSTESDLPGLAPLTSLYGIGYRYSLACTYEISQALELSLKIGESRYKPNSESAVTDKASIGMQCDIAF
jgi:hypothetical protein